MAAEGKAEEEAVAFSDSMDANGFRLNRSIHLGPEILAWPLAVIGVELGLEVLGPVMALLFARFDVVHSSCHKIIRSWVE